jgi:hypothetical protein
MEMMSFAAIARRGAEWFSIPLNYIKSKFTQRTRRHHRAWFGAINTACRVIIQQPACVRDYYNYYWRAAALCNI